MDADEIRAFFAALSRGDRDALEGRLHEDVTLEFPGRRFGGRFSGRRAVLVFLRQNQRLFRGGLEFTVEWSGVVGDLAAARWTNRGTTRDGREYANRGATFLRVEDGLVTEIHDYLDTETIAETWPA